MSSGSQPPEGPITRARSLLLAARTQSGDEQVASLQQLETQLEELTAEITRLNSGGGTPAPAGVTATGPPAHNPPAVVTLQGLKLPSFPQNDKTAVHEWAKTTKVFWAKMATTEQDNFTALVNCLGINAKSFVVDAISKDPNLTSVNLVDLLTAHYGHANPKAAATQALEALKQTAEEDFQTYQHRAEGIFSLLHDIAESEKLRRIVAGLQTPYYDALESLERVLRYNDPTFERSYEKTTVFLTSLDPTLAPKKAKRSMELNSARTGNFRAKGGGRGARNEGSSSSKREEANKANSEKNAKPKDGKKAPQAGQPSDPTQEERNRRRAAGLCMFCSAPWEKGHRCLRPSDPNGGGVQSSSKN